MIPKLPDVPYADVTTEGEKDRKRHLRIAMVAACPFPCPRGTPVRIARMSEALVDRGHEVHVVTYHLGEGEIRSAVHVHRTPRVPTYRRLDPGPTYQKLLLMDTLLVRELRRLLDGRAFDVIHAHHFEGLAVALASARDLAPIVFDAHTLLESELPFYRLGLSKKVLKSLGKKLDRVLPRKADHVIAVTEEIRTNLEEGAEVPANKITVIGNGVDWTQFPDRSAGGWPGRPGRIVFAGNLAPYQGVELLIQALSKVRDPFPEAHLVIATEDVKAMNLYRPLLRDLGLLDSVTVKATSFSELPEVLAEAAVAANPRPACPGVPMKVLNYMAAGLPIVSFEGSGKGLDHGRTGWLVPDGDVVAFGEGLAHLLADPQLASNLGAKARREVIATASWALTAKSVEEVYESLGLG